MKIVFIAKYFYPTKRVSGLSDFVYNLASYLAKKLDIVVISSQIDKNEPKSLKHKKFKIIKIKGNFITGAIKSVKEISPDLIWIFSGIHNPNVSSLYFWPIKIFSTCPVVFQQGTHFSKKLLKSYNYFWQKFDLLIAAHPQIQSQFICQGLKAQFLPPILDISQYKNALKKITSLKLLKIGYFGHLNNIKGADTILKIAKEIESPKAEFIIAGEGPLAEEIKNFAKNNKNLKFYQYLSKKSLISKIKECDLIILPFKTSETILGYSYIALEAMALKVPIIAKKQAVFQGLIENKKNGFLFSQNKELIKIINNILAKPEILKKIGQEAYQKIKKEFDVKNIGKDYLIIAKNIIDQRKKIQNYYNDYSKWYDKERTGKYYSVINELEFSAIKPYMKNKKSLELGCGTGIILNMADLVAKKAFGIDLSPGMAKMSQKKGLDARVGSATEIPFKDNTFDIVYSFKVLAHIPDIKKAVQEATRVTKKGGVLALEFYNPYSIKFVTNKLQKIFTCKKVFIRYDSLAKIKSYLPKGVKIKKIRGVRIITPFNFCFRIPVIAPVFKFLERKLADSPMKYLGSYFVVIMKKD